MFFRMLDKTFYSQRLDSSFFCRGNMHHAKEMMYMRRFNLYLPVELFERIKLLSKFYNISITKLMVELLEIGYIDMIDTRKK